MSFVFGIERQLSNKQVGFGTFIFVAIGTCTLGVLSSVLSPTNLLILAGGIVTGVGFLGAGALVKTSDKIFGFTTAASIWIFAIIGLSIGIGQYTEGVLAYFAMLLVVMTDKFMEHKGVESYRRRITIKTKNMVSKEEVLKMFENYKWKLINLEIDKKEKKCVFVYLVSVPRNEINGLKENIVSKKWVEFLKIE